MRKVSSAPSLQELGRIDVDKQGGRAAPKGSCIHTALRGQKEPCLKNRRSQNVSTGSLPQFLQHAYGPSDVASLQETLPFRLAGLDCYEKFGHRQDPAPALQGQADEPLIGRALMAQKVQREEDEKAFATCIATPISPNDRNLGELVEDAVREKQQAAEEELNERIRASIQLPRREHIGTGDSDGVHTDPRKRKRRFLESFGFGKNKQNTSDNIFEDNDLAENHLSGQATLEDEDNRVSLPDDWACRDKLCYTVVRVDENLFDLHCSPQKKGSRETEFMPRAQSVQQW